jgi:hypothetical protein
MLRNAERRKLRGTHDDEDRKLIEQISANTRAMQAVVAERIWYEHPEWHRGAPTAQRRVQRMAREMTWDLQLEAEHSR